MPQNECVKMSGPTPALAPGIAGLATRPPGFVLLSSWTGKTHAAREMPGPCCNTTFWDRPRSIKRLTQTKRSRSMDVQAVNVVIGGEAGQGLVTVGQLLAKSLVRSGFEILVSQSYMSRIRGGHNTFTIRCGVGPILAPREGVDLLIALDRETIAIHAQELAPGASTIVDVALFEGVEISCASCLKVPFNDISKPRYHNVVALGAAGALLGLDRTILLVAVESLFGKKHPEVTEENRRALDVAYDWTASQNLTGFRLPVRQPAPQRLMMNGNEAIALGAMAAGVKFCAFYPMTPSTTVALTLAAQARSQGLVVEQAEDEIA
ncbi:MAG TPA: hypothetical protein DCZ69_16655, partial [Syntrophobacteraceae bacterium]|nr:hypothetical protein [Syntrophobacteraceae bacterium]